MTQKSVNIYPNNFIIGDDGRYVVTIDAATLGIGGTQFFSTLKVVRREAVTGSPWRNILCQYEIATNGDLKLFFDETFIGRVTLLTES